MTETAIRIENLTRDFETVRAVDGLSLEVPAGMIFGFLNQARIFSSSKLGLRSFMCLMAVLLRYQIWDGAVNGRSATEDPESAAVGLP